MLKNVLQMVDGDLPGLQMSLQKQEDLKEKAGIN